MECVMSFMQIMIAIILPVWIYLWLDEHIRRQFSYYLGIDLDFTVKRWWAIWCISKEKRNKSINRNMTKKPNLKEFLKSGVDNPKILIDDNSCDTVSFYGADQKGNSLFVKMNHKGYRIVELILQVTLSDGRIYVLPDYPDVTTNNINQKWSTLNLKIEVLEPRQRWRIAYNGLLRNQCQGDTSNDNNVEHVRLNLIFIKNSITMEWPNDWSMYLHADALAREPWKNPAWIHKIKLLEHKGYDQWGSIIGQITFENSLPTDLYLRGLCQRRWGKHESYQFHQIVTLLGVTTNGAMYYLVVSKTKNSFSHMQYGHIKQVNEKVSKIDWMDMKLSDFEQQDDNGLLNHKITFIAAGKKYESIIKNTVGDAIISYNGDPWSWTSKTRNLHVQLNGNKGLGLILMSYPYTGPKQYKQIKPVAKIQRLRKYEELTDINKYILYFNDRLCRNESIVGGKGYSLAVLTAIKTEDFIVPKGFCITNFALKWQLQHHKELQNMIANVVDISCGKKNEDLNKYCDETMLAIQNTAVEEQIVNAVLKGLEKLELSVPNINKKTTLSNRYAIRSSAIGEDSEETSAAGQNSTYLGIGTTSDIIKSIAKCWASLYSYQSVEYRRQNGLPIQTSMGVCVQIMADAQAAGVMFTRHPTTGNPSSISITANYGLGETVVSGMVEPDTFTIRRKWDNTLIISTSNLGNKKQKILLTDNGVIKNNLSEQEIKQFSISDETALNLAKIGVLLESIFGSARDIEWAVVGKQIFLLQARPITTINAWTDFELMHEQDTGVPSDIDFITFANVGEVLPNPISPLTISTILKVIDLSIGMKSNDYSRNYLHMVGMRCSLNYFNTCMVEISKEITMTNKMTDMAICGRIVTTPEIHKTAVEKNGFISTWKKIYLMYEMFKLAWLNEKTVQTAIEVSNKYILGTNAFDIANNLYNFINKKYDEIFTVVKCHSHASNVSVSCQIIAMSLLTKGSMDFTSNHLADIATLLSSCANVISTEVPIALKKIASYIKKSGNAKSFSKLKPADVMSWLKLNCPQAAEELCNFFNIHGCRCIQELDLYSEPWILKPDEIINTIQTLAISLEGDYVNTKLSEQETIESLKTPLSSIIKWLLKIAIPYSRKAVMRREMTKSIIVSVVHKMRLAYRRLGILMVAENYVPDKDLIFFLTHQEIGQLLNSHNPILVRKALRRKRIYHQVAKLEYPEFNIGMPIPIQNSLDISPTKECTKIEATSVYGGSVMGRACVITDLCQAKTLKHGDILITHCTDIGWSPYFPLLGGIVTELGGLISHGAVVAREYGLPCIVGAKCATHIFCTGDTVLLVGDIGVLQLVKKA